YHNKVFYEVHRSTDRSKKETAKKRHNTGRPEATDDGDKLRNCSIEEKEYEKRVQNYLKNNPNLFKIHARASNIKPDRTHGISPGTQLPHKFSPILSIFSSENDHKVDHVKDELTSEEKYTRKR
ncbi:hypothetical protein L9F63_020679, partial [Diploptera punctata]